MLAPVERRLGKFVMMIMMLLMASEGLTCATGDIDIASIASVVTTEE